MLSFLQLLLLLAIGTGYGANLIRELFLDCTNDITMLGKYDYLFFGIMEKLYSRLHLPSPRYRAKVHKPDKSLHSKLFPSLFLVALYRTVQGRKTGLTNKKIKD
jgi:hypothetical protein